MSIPDFNNKPIIPALNISGIRDTELDNYVQDKIDKLINNPSYPTPFPELDAVIPLREAYVIALADAHNGTPAQTEEKNIKRFDLENAVILLAYRCAKLSVGNKVKFLSSGFEMRKGRTPAPLLEGPDGLDARDGTLPGTILLKWTRLRKAICYTVQISQNPTDESSWQTIHSHLGGISTRTKTLIKGLANSTRYFFRIAGVNSAGVGSWSEPATRTTQ